MVDLNDLSQKVAKILAFEIPKEADAYEAGYDCEKNGANEENCHYTFFATPELTAAWERGKEAARRCVAPVE
jgi:hypothetical protein